MLLLFRWLLLYQLVGSGHSKQLFTETQKLGKVAAGIQGAFTVEAAFV